MTQPPSSRALGMSAVVLAVALALMSVLYTLAASGDDDAARADTFTTMAVVLGTGAVIALLLVLANAVLASRPVLAARVAGAGIAAGLVLAAVCVLVPGPLREPVLQLTSALMCAFLAWFSLAVQRTAAGRAGRAASERR